MLGSGSKIALAVGITALLTAVVLIAIFAGYLFYRDSGSAPSPATSGDRGVKPSPSARTRSNDGPAASEITSISFASLTMGSGPMKNAASMLSNINVQNFSSTSLTITFSSDGSASKRTTTQSTKDGQKSERSESMTASITTDEFLSFAKVFAENDFTNEPDSKDITSLPIKITLTITYKGGTKSIIAGHTGKDTPELAAMLKAVRELDHRTKWLTSQQ